MHLLFSFGVPENICWYFSSVSSEIDFGVWNSNFGESVSGSFVKTNGFTSGDDSLMLMPLKVASSKETFKAMLVINCLLIKRLPISDFIIGVDVKTFPSTPSNGLRHNGIFFDLSIRCLLCLRWVGKPSESQVLLNLFLQESSLNNSSQLRSR